MKKLSLDELASELGFESSETDEALAEAWDLNWIICSYGDDVDPLGNEYLTPEKASEIAAVDSGLIYAYRPGDEWTITRGCLESPSE